MIHITICITNVGWKTPEMHSVAKSQRASSITHPLLDKAQRALKLLGVLCRMGNYPNVGWKTPNVCVLGLTTSLEGACQFPFADLPPPPPHPPPPLQADFGVVDHQLITKGEELPPHLHPMADHLLIYSPIVLMRIPHSCYKISVFQT